MASPLSHSDEETNSAGEDSSLSWEFVPGFGIGSRIESRRGLYKLERGPPLIDLEQELHVEVGEEKPDEEEKPEEPIAPGTPPLEWNHDRGRPRRRLSAKTPLARFHSLFQ